VKGRPHYYSSKKEEYAHIRFDLDAGWSTTQHLLLNYLFTKRSTDFTSLFNWNTKQLFVWVLATYPSSTSSPTAPPSQAIIWDTIINSESQSHPFTPYSLFQEINPSTAKSGSIKSSTSSKEEEPKPGIIKLKNAKPKYQITDISGKLASRGNVTLEVGWNVQPWVGALTWTTGEGQGFGRWKGMRGGKSKAFDMPALKGKSAGQETVVGKGKPKAAEVTPVTK